MKLTKLLLAVVGATVLLGALVSNASAGHLSSSSRRFRAVWGAMIFSGGLATVECEVTLEGELHSRSINKTAGLLIGYITEARVQAPPCRRGSATILRETLPWHVQYLSFTGSLPNITSVIVNVIGSSFRVREPFGGECLARSTAAQPTIGTYNLASGTGAVNSVAVSGTIRCRGGIEIEGRLTGTSTSVEDGAGNRVSITLI